MTVGYAIADGEETFTLTLSNAWHAFRFRVAFRE